MNVFNVGTPKDETVGVGRLSRLKQLVFVGYVPVASNSIYFSKINDGCIRYRIEVKMERLGHLDAL